jgi:hypothetical protein
MPCVGVREEGKRARGGEGKRARGQKSKRTRGQEAGHVLTSYHVEAKAL